MAAPKKLRLVYEGEHVSAITYPMQQSIDDFHPFCRACIPEQTHMIPTCEVTQYGFENDVVYLVYTCGTCTRQYAWPFKVFHIQGEV